jgi:hypothetical protein
MRAAVFLAMVVLTVTCGPSPDAKLPGDVSNNGGSITPSHGGSTETGGTPGTGGIVSTGGTTAVGSGGKVGTGGVTAAGGSNSTGGVSGAGSGGTVASGGVSGVGGTTSTDAGRPIDGAANCMGQVVSKAYTCGAAPACSACVINSVSKEEQCKAGVDCLAAAGASCDSNCQLNCFNKAGDAQVKACISALQTAACGAGGGC